MCYSGSKIIPVPPHRRGIPPEKRSPAHAFSGSKRRVPSFRPWPTGGPVTRGRFFLALGSLVVLVASVLSLEGRSLLGSCPSFALWEGDIWSSCCSQRLLDPYSFTHVLHGMAFFGVLALLAPRRSLPFRGLLALTLEGLWEMAENSPLIIQRYREATIALGYVGDSVLNSLGDLLCCGAGFVLAHHLGWKKGALVFVLTEVTLLFWVRDNLSLNVLMLLFPLDAVKAWQMGH